LVALHSVSFLPGVVLSYEMLVGQRPGGPRLSDRRIEEGAGNVAVALQNKKVR
jgi:hypothetical protein